LRRMVGEHRLSADQLIYPLFVVPGKGVKEQIDSMPGVHHFSIERLVTEAQEVKRLGIPAILLFGVPEDRKKNSKAREAYNPKGIVQQAVAALKRSVPGLVVITDVCLCAYTDHGHCGVVKDGRVLNDPSLEILAKTALSHALAGADMVAPSDMMDGRVGAIRALLDKKNFSHLPIMSYAAKYSSSFYGPFREAAESAPKFGDRKSYQMDPANLRMALREVELDIKEGADIVMVKPGLAYLDVVAAVRQKFHIPVAAYNVSGEYSMVKAAAQKGWIDEKAVVLETLLGFTRAGADMIITYHAKDAAKWIKEAK